MKKQVSILLIEDNPNDAQHLQNMLPAYRQVDFEWIMAENLPQGCEQLKQDNIDIVLLGSSIKPDGITQLREVNPQIAVINLIEPGNDESGLESIRMGAQDYLVKNDLTSGLLAYAILYTVEHQQTEYSRSQKEEFVYRDAEVALRDDSQAYFRILAEYSQAGIYIVQDGLFRYVNPALATIFGYSPQEIIDKLGPKHLSHPEDYPNIEQQIESRLSGENQSSHYFFRGIHRDKHEVYCEVLGSRTDFRGKPAIIGTLLDITERKQVENKLIEERNLLRTLIDNLPSHVYMVDQETRVMLSNLANARFLGFDSADDVIGKKTEELLPEDVARRVTADDKPILEQGIPLLDQEDYTADSQGKMHWLLTTKVPLRDRENNITGFVGITRNITDIKETQQKLLESQNLLQSALDALSANIAILDENGCVIAVNEAWRQFARENDMVHPDYGVGTSYFEVCERAANEDSYEAQLIAESIQKIIDGDLDRFSIEYSCHSPTQQRWFVAQMNRFENQGVARVVVAHQDVTERVLAELAERDQRILAETIRDTITALTSSLDPDMVMSLILENVERVVSYRAGNIMLIEGDHARIVYTRGYDEKTDSAIKDLNFSLETSTLNQMLMTSEPCFIPDTLDYQAWDTVHGTKWVRSYMGVPIQGHGQVIGFLNLDSDIPNFFNQAHIERLVAFAEQVAIALQNAQMYNILNEYAGEITTLYRTTSFLFTTLHAGNIAVLAQEIVNTVVKTFGQVDCGLLLVDETKEELIRLARAGRYQVHATQPLYMRGSGLAPEAARTKRTVYVPDVTLDSRYVPNEPRTRSELVIPLKIGELVIGVLDLQSSDQDAFSERDQRMLEAYADRAASALENARLYEKIQNHADELEQRVNERTAELLEAKERVEAILNSASDAVVMTNPEGLIRQTNPAFDTMFGYEADEPFGWTLSRLVMPDSEAALTTTLHLITTGQNSRRLELAALRKDGSTFDADMALSAIKESKSNVAGIICIFRDITERKQIEESLRKALEKERELGELKSRFVSMASHEFRTPLATILSSGDLLKNYWHKMTEEHIQHHIQNIHEQVDHMTQLLEDILTIGRAEAGKLAFNPVSLDIRAFCQKLADELQQGAGSEHKIHFTVSGACEQILADKKLLRQALENLLTNAVKYSPKGSSVYFDLNCSDAGIKIQVKDEGIGIPEKDQSKIFESFHRATNVGTIPGTGLGLAIAYRAIQLHSGSISVLSEIGIGTNFTITLPTIASGDSTHDDSTGN